MKILRTLTRVCVNDLDSATAFYENLTGQKTGLRIAMPEAGLELAQVGDVLIIGGNDDALIPFRQTRATFLVDSLAEYHRFLTENGTTILRPPQKVPTGMNMTVRHPDGLIAEYVEHDRNNTAFPGSS
jgi:predicted enzyme related to lactoylglutathione lyase